MPSTAARHQTLTHYHATYDGCDLERHCQWHRDAKRQFAPADVRRGLTTQRIQAAAILSSKWSQLPVQPAH